MGQQDVMEFLEAHPDSWFTSREISGGTGMGITPAIQALKKLRDYDEILFRKRKLKNRMGEYEYRYKS